MPSLLVKNADGERYVPLEGIVTIGRHPNNSICIPESAISKQHARIQKTSEGYVYKDLDSANGSFFNELKIKQQVLHDGDMIRVGKTWLVFQHESSISDDIESLVSFEQFDGEDATEYQERIAVEEEEQFAPESEIHDIAMLRVDYEKLRLGLALLQHVNTERSLTRLLKTISKQLINMFMADRVVILLLNDRGVFEAKAVQSLEKIDAPISVSKSVLNEVQTTKSAVLLSDSGNENEIAKVSSLMLMGIQSVMCSPLIHNNQVIGAVHIDLHKGQGSFEKKDLQLLGGVCTYIAMAVTNANLTQAMKKEAKMQAQFERLLSPSIVKQLMTGKLKIGKAGELRKVTVMFVDIRDFTRMSHKASPAAVVNLLNQYFDRVVEIIFKHGGTVDKFMGDAVMVLFGAPIPMNQQEDAAIACAVEIQTMLKHWNQERIKQKKGLIPVGIGINTGEVVVGSIGSSKTMQYTCIGDAVNIASRLTGIAKAGQILANKTTVEAAQSPIVSKPLPPTSIKGIDGLVEASLIVRIGR